MAGSQGCTPSRSVLAAAADGVEHFISRQGGRPEAVMARSRLDANDLSNPRHPLDLASYCALMEHAASDSHDLHFGLHFGQTFQPERLGLIGELALASPTLGSALINLATFFPYHQQVTETRFVERDGLMRLEYRILDGRIVERRQDAELTMGMFRNIVRRCLGMAWSPLQVHFEHPQSGNIAEHQTVFGASVYFGQRTNALVWRASDLEQRLPSSQPSRMSRLREALTGVSGGTGSLAVVDRVRGEIRSSLSSGALQIEAIACDMGIARWTLQRRLAEAGLTFSELVEEVRSRVAMQYLREPFLPVADIAALLGYSETSAFTRSCTRWFGLPPSAMRQAGPPAAYRAADCARRCMP